MTDIHGVLLVDKPCGPTSHDIVALARRALGVSAVGHTGTLDPMASGLLVLTVGEAAKLAAYLSADDKEYAATIVLGSETDTLDAQGTEIKSAPVTESLSQEAVDKAAGAFRGAFKQSPPAISAIKQEGVRLYKRARRGEKVEAPAREVVARELRIVRVAGREIDLVVRCSKGFYVRSLARDLALALGTVGHLSALRRTRSGRFEVGQAVALEQLERAVADSAFRDALISRLISPAEACANMAQIMLTDQGCEDARHGRPIAASRISSGTLPETDSGPIALLDRRNQLVAIARLVDGALRVQRGFHIE